ncbi:MAG: copper resistance protein CopD [Capnocytophaga sp.]|nr:copper resistance protein CopD [Capnocytophaga sp.]
MSYDQLLLIIHIVAATAWIGGNLFISIVYAPRALKSKSPAFINNFSNYEIIGLPALIVSLLTGIGMSYRRGIGIDQWFHFQNPMEGTISIKLLIFIVMSILIIFAKTTIIPKLKRHDVKQLPASIAYIATLTLMGLLFLIIGTYLRYGGLLLFN